MLAFLFVSFLLVVETNGSRRLFPFHTDLMESKEGERGC